MKIIIVILLGGSAIFSIPALHPIFPFWDFSESLWKGMVTGFIARMIYKI